VGKAAPRAAESIDEAEFESGFKAVGPWCRELICANEIELPVGAPQQNPLINL
jgi:hypothetical protein